jgi:hypothetical protein
MSKLLKILTKADIYQRISEGPIPQHFVWWDDITDGQFKAFEQVVTTAKDERPIQCFLEINPLILVQHLHGGHGRWVAPRIRFGAEYIPDFVIGESSSMGFRWTIVELESPRSSLFTKSGNPAKALNQAIRQISDWRAWLKDNRDYAARSENESGLGLQDIDLNVQGLILIGRRDSISAKCNKLRRQLSESLNIQIHTYDYLLDAARHRVAWAVSQKK